jgi:hypothetical protein
MKKWFGKIQQIFGFGPTDSLSNVPDSFQRLLEQHGMTFQVPENITMSIREIVDNRNMPYHFAFRHNYENFEVRYHLQDFTGVSEQSAKGLLMATVMNISGGNFESMSQFPPEAVDKEFGADWGMMSLASLEQVPFASGFTEGMVVLIRKGDQAAYIFYLMDQQTQPQFPELSAPIFTALRYQEG